ncbi:MAG: CHASE2 domain-containing protein [Deltaproteobacteria bacterium]|jgi:putative nucleotidyltransferase with HDIG domain|nr:CHASE2 domain-containing protein [Deltaproteobacteria bacterium]
MGQFLRSKLGMIFLSLLAGLAGVLLTFSDLAILTGPAMTIFDYYQSMVQPPPPPEKLAIVLVGERTLQEIGNWPIPRRVHAQILGRLNLSRYIVLDILFPEYTTPEDDALLAAVVKESNKVITAIQLTPDDKGVLNVLGLPYPELAESVTGMGVVNVQQESDGIYRDYNLLWPLEGNPIPSMPLAIYLAARNQIPSITREGSGFRADLDTGPIYLNKDLTFKIHHPEPSVPIYEYIDVLTGKISPETFRDAITLVGVNASGASDYFSVGLGQLLPGSAFIANATRTLLTGWVPFQAPLWAVLLAGGLLSALGWLSSFLRRWGGPIMVLVFLVWVGLTFFLFVHFRIWLSPLPPLLPALLATGISALLRLKFLAVDWEIQRISIDSLLFLGRQDFDPSKTTFADFLWNNWSDIEKWSKITLVSPLASLEDLNKAGFVEKEEFNTTKSSANLSASVIKSRTGIRHLLLELPELESGEKHYTLLAWHGRLSNEVIKSVAALILSAAMHFKALEENQARKDLFYGLIDVIIGAVDAKDPTTAGHSKRVAELSRELGRAVGLSEKELDDIHLGGLLHDVGKIGIPDFILNKPGKLDDSEMAIMQSHPGIGEELMSRIKLPETIMKAIVEHHERLDGLGYPKGLRDSQLSLAGRILKIADVYDALASKRQYKDIMSLEKIKNILLSGIGTEFDEKVTRIFLAMQGLDTPETEKEVHGLIQAAEVTDPLTAFPIS